MKYFFLFFLIIGYYVNAQNKPANYIDSGSFLLHKFAQNIGKETYKVSKNDNQLVYDINFRFVDRGSPVPLEAQLITNNDQEPISLFIKGSTSRFSTINDSIRIKNNQVAIRIDDSMFTKSLPVNAYPIGGYSPGTAQMLLLQYWKKKHQPASIPLLPVGSATIKADGKDTVSFNQQKLVLERFIIGGLIWGNEIVWTNNKGQLICLITNDAEGDKLEMMEESHESLLPELLKRSAQQGMKLFSQSMKLNTHSNHTLAILGGKVVDVEGKGEELSDILIENGLIKQIGKAGTMQIPAKATIIKASGKTILPGLWDMHAHFEQAEWGPAYLAAGVTTVRDCGNEFDYINAIKNAIDLGQGVGPNILKAGIIDGSGKNGLGIVKANTKEEAIEQVQRYKNNGFVQIKIYSSVKPVIVKAICDEAHRLNLSVTGHIPNGMTIQQGVDSGMNQVNHIQYVYSVMKKNADRSVNLNDSTNKAILNFLRDHQVVIDPTIGVFEMTFRSTKDAITDMEPAFYSLPLPLQALFKNMGMPANEAKMYAPVYLAMKNLVKALLDNGVMVVAGTDMGFPGYSLARELELYVEAGFTPMQAIQSATILPAIVMKVADKTGSLQVGKQADLIIINGNPLQNIRDIRKVEKVIKAGQEYDPVILHKMVGFKN